MTFKNVLLSVLVAGAALSPVTGGAGTRDTGLTAMICEWNETVFRIAVVEDRLLTLKGLRTACLMHLAVHDALNAIDPRYEPYAFDGTAPDADAVAAVAQASFNVAAAQYPDRSAELAERLTANLAMSEDQQARESGVALGAACAAAVLEAREGDGWNTEAEYTWHPMGPGVYAEFNEHSGTPEGFIFGAGWAKATPWVLNAPDQFRVPPPPSIESDEYIAAYREVKDVGRFQTMTRTQDQSHLALWWKDFLENSCNRLTRQLVVAEQVDPWVTARTFALLNMSIYDGYISSFDNKFLYNHWRPYTAIRWADNDGNPATEPDTLWNNLHRHTYAFPSYPSAHGTAGAAAMMVLADTFGDDFSFTMTNPLVDIAGPLGPKISMEPPTRSFNSFSDAAMECAMSRVYLGIHFRYDSVQGNWLGNQVGQYVVDHALRRIQ